MRGAPAAALLLIPAFASAEPRTVYETTVTAAQGDTLPDERATSTLRRGEIDRRQPRSTPDALRFEPGVFVQQTAHGQGSAFIRGLTGQQTLILFDGIRVNNATFRQGPNQYLFTLDLRSIDRVEVLRGGGSTRFGSDALGGVVDAVPVEPPDVAVGTRGYVTPRLFARGSTADSERGGAVSVAWGAALPRDLTLTFVGGAGVREAGLLRSGGPIVSPENGLPTNALPENLRRDVPRFAPDGVTQLGTGFKELTGDGRLVLRIGDRHVVKLAAYAYRQYDVPRTDQCPPAEAPWNECLTFDEQFRTLVYAAWDGPLGAAAKSARATLSWQRYRERRSHVRPASYYTHRGLDEVESIGATFRALSPSWWERPWLPLRATYGADLYVDRVASAAQVELSDLKLARGVRGQYVDGALYVTGGAFAEVEAQFGRRITVRGGGRLSAVAARSPTVIDPREGFVDTPAIDRRWFPLVGHAGVEVHATSWLTALANVDHSFRAPNLDDLVARQPTGAGYQCGNPGLDPERATTFEAGLRLRTAPVTADVWLFETLLHDLVVKERAEACPGGDAFRAIVRLANAHGLSEVRGVEGAVRVRLPRGGSGRATLSYAWGEGPSVAPPPDRVPVSRIPPLNGTVEIGWALPAGFSVGGALRWAAKQDRLALADLSDTRIPYGGTPGFAVLDLRASYRTAGLALHAVFENLLDAAYRYHGSSVNGAGRGFILSVETMPF